MSPRRTSSLLPQTPTRYSRARTSPNRGWHKRSSWLAHACRRGDPCRVVVKVQGLGRECKVDVVLAKNPNQLQIDRLLDVHEDIEVRAQHVMDCLKVQPLFVSSTPLPALRPLCSQCHRGRGLWHWYHPQETKQFPDSLAFMYTTLRLELIERAVRHWRLHSHPVVPLREVCGRA